MDLGREMKEPGAIPATPVDEKQPKITYPGFSLSDNSADEFTKDNKPKLGDEYTATVKIRVVSLTADKYSRRVEFDVMTLDDITSASESKDEDTEKSDKDEEKMLGFKRKKTEKEAPSLGAKDLVD